MCIVASVLGEGGLKEREEMALDLSARDRQVGERALAPPSRQEALDDRIWSHIRLASHQATTFYGSARTVRRRLFIGSVLVTCSGVSVVMLEPTDEQDTATHTIDKNSIKIVIHTISLCRQCRC